MVELISIADDSVKKYSRFPSNQYNPMKLTKTDTGYETFDEAQLLITEKVTKTG